MGWVAARDQLVTILEGTTVPTKKRDSGNAFHYEPQASRTNPPTTRGFFFEVPAITTIRLIRNGGTWESAECSIAMAYAIDLEPAARLEVMMRDRAEIVARLLSPSNWAQSTSTIIKVAHSGEDDLLPTVFEDVPGAVLMVMRARVQFSS